MWYHQIHHHGHADRRDQKDIETTMFFKCTRWQLEETLNPSDCPYHYYCHSTYPGNYPYLVDILVLAFVAASFLSTMVLSLIEIISSVKSINLQQLKRTRRYVLPSGPTSLPIMLLILAKGYRINTLFPITCTGPAILQLICISALAFESETGTSNSSSSTIRYLFLEASALSGAIHAALYLDSVILPYYTGLDALASSTFSGECMSCVCRQTVLVPGGVLILYRGWSVTTALVVATLCLRISCRLAPEYREKTVLVKSMSESLSLILMTAECVYLMMIFAPDKENTWPRVASFCGVFVLLCLHILRRLFPWLVVLFRGYQESKVQQC